MTYQSELDRFDPDRGDVLSISKEDATELANLPGEIALPIIHALLRYFALGKPGDPVPTMEDPRDNAMLARYIEHQRKNAARRADFLARQRENANNGWAKRKAADKGKKDATGCHGIPRHTTATSTSIRTEEEEQVPEGEGLVSSSQRGKPSSVVSESQPPSAGACAGARPAAVESGHTMRTATIDEWVGHGDETFDEGDLRERPVQFVLDMGIDEDENRARPFYLRALQQLGPDVYAETCWRFIEAYVAAANAYGKTVRELEANWDANEAKYTAQGATWDSIIAKAEDKNWHCIKTEREYYEKHSVGGGRILAGMLKEAGLAHGIDLGANRSKKGGDK